jgi:hypothetical protein
VCPVRGDVLFAAITHFGVLDVFDVVFPFWCGAVIGKFALTAITADLAGTTCSATAATTVITAHAIPAVRSALGFTYPI